LLPVEWKEGEWPVWNESQHVTVKITAGSKQLVPTSIDHPGLSALSASQSEVFQFGSGKLENLPLNLLFCREPDLSYYSFKENEATLIGSANTPATRKGQFTFFGRRQTDISFSLEFKLSFHPSGESSEEAGLLVYLDCDRYIPYKIISSSSPLNKLAPSHATSESARTVRLGDDMELCNDASNLRPPMAKKLEGKSEWVDLKVIAKRRWYEFYYKPEDGGDWIHSGNAMARRVSGGFTGEKTLRRNRRMKKTDLFFLSIGVIVGAYATGNGQKSNASAKVKDFKYTTLETH
jgi:xylan 1,4-beta-xylosidase